MAKTARKKAAKPAAKKSAAEPAAKPKPAPKRIKPVANPAGAGGAESAAWVAARKLSTAGKLRWYVQIALDVGDGPAAEVYSGDTSTRFHIDLYRDEWGFTFVHEGKTSHIRRETETFVHGFDGHALHKQMPALGDVGTLIKSLEAKHGIAFKRAHAHIRSNLAGAKPAIRDWLATI